MAAAGCGGGGEGEESDDPLAALVEDAGLEVCAESQTLGIDTDYEGLNQAQTLVIAEDCGKPAVKPTTFTQAAFATASAAEAAAATLEKQNPDAVVVVSNAVVYVVSGPDAEEYADRLREATGVPASTTG